MPRTKRTPAQRHEEYVRNRAVILARVSRYQKRNREAIRRKLRQARLDDPGKYKKRYRENYKKNKEKILRACNEYHRANRERLLPKMRASYRKHRKERLARQKRYYRAHKMAVRAYQAQYNRKNAAAVLARHKVYRQEHLAQLQAYDRYRARHLSPARVRSNRAWQLNNRQTIRNYREKVCAKARLMLGNKCELCGWREIVSLLQFDHKISFMKRGVKRPRSGSSTAYEVLRTPDRIQLLCPICHAIKTAIEKRSRNPHPTRWRVKYQKARNRLIDQFGNRCAQCGYDENPLAFQFDHKEPIWGKGRSSAVHHALKWPEKFQMLCALCHVKKGKVDRERRRQLRSGKSG